MRHIPWDEVEGSDEPSDKSKVQLSACASMTDDDDVTNSDSLNSIAEHNNKNQDLNLIFMIFCLNKEIAN